MRRPYVSLLIALSLLAVPAFADLEEGLVAVRERRYDDALRTLMPLAEAGNPAAQHAVGLLYLNGQGVDRDAETALAWSEKAALGGDVEAQFQVGIAYLNGIGVKQDLSRSLAWFLIAREDGSEPAAEGVAACEASMKPKQIARAREIVGEIRGQMGGTRP